MAKTIKRLKDLQVKRLSKPGAYPDGEGLYLQVRDSGAKDWFYRYEVAGKGRKRGLGSYPTVSLEQAREDALECRQLRKNGVDPIERSKNLELEKALDNAKATTFKECADTYINTHKHGWRDERHEYQWRKSLENYAYPVIGDLPVQSIDIDLVMKVIEPIWFDKTETASRVRQRIENILDLATVRKLRIGDNPALWRGRLDKLLPKRSKVQKQIHFAAMDYRDVPEYFQSLRTKDTIASKALAFTILTATRTSESRGAVTDEIDLKGNIWVIPDSRMKADREHRVPLSGEALKIIEEVKPFKRQTDEFLFPGRTGDKPTSASSLLKIVKQHDETLTVHGFRSAFRDWCAEQTNFPREVAEAALAHSLKDKTEAAYQRGDLFEKRSKLMDQWAQYCLKGKGKADVLPIRRKAK
jgi:integrase